MDLNHSNLHVQYLLSLFPSLLLLPLGITPKVVTLHIPLFSICLSCKLLSKLWKLYLLIRKVKVFTELSSLSPWKRDCPHCPRILLPVTGCKESWTENVYSSSLALRVERAKMPPSGPTIQRGRITKCPRFVPEERVERFPVLVYDSHSEFWSRL